MNSAQALAIAAAAFVAAEESWEARFSGARAQLTALAAQAHALGVASAQRFAPVLEDAFEARCNDDGADAA
jgi:hypothetical protein